MRHPWGTSLKLITLWRIKCLRPKSQPVDPWTGWSPGGWTRWRDHHQPGFCRSELGWGGADSLKRYKRKALCSWTHESGHWVQIPALKITTGVTQSKPYPTRDLRVLIGKAGWRRRTRQSQRSPQVLIVQEPKSVVLRESCQLSTHLDAITHLSAHTWMTLSVHTSGWHHLSLVPP